MTCSPKYPLPNIIPRKRGEHKEPKLSSNKKSASFPITMRCLQLQSFPLHHAKPKPQLHHARQTTKLFRLSTHNIPSTSPLTTKLKALPQFMVVANAVTPPAQSGDLSGLLPISAVLLSLYFVANFVVPSFIIKSFEDQKVDDVNTRKDE